MPRSRVRVTVQIVCDQCGETVDRDTFNPSQPPRFCSDTCNRASRTTSIDVICAQCGKSFGARPSRIAMGFGKLCSGKCRASAKEIPVEQQFIEKVDRSGGPDTCWPWMGDRNRSGYGRIPHCGEKIRAHVYAWERANGRKVPDGLVVRHLCPGGGNPWCCNDTHLDIGTHKQNAEDRVDQGRSLKGEKSPAAKLTDAQVVEIRRLLGTGLTPVKLMPLFPVSLATIARIARGVSR